MPKSKIISAGFDLSLTGTGVIVLENDKIVKQHLIKSKPTPDGTPKDEVLRILKIVDEIEKIVGIFKPEVAVIEGLAFMVRNATALVQLSALNYMIRSMLITYDTPFVIVAPTSLKKFVTGNGGAKKDVMLIETFKRWGVTLLDDNICDSFGLAQIGLALKGGVCKKIGQKQEEVLSLLKKQLN